MVKVGRWIGSRIRLLRWRQWFTSQRLFLLWGHLRSCNGRLGSLNLYSACGRFALFRGLGRLVSGFGLGWVGVSHYPLPSQYMRPFKAKVLLFRRTIGAGHLRWSRATGCTVRVDARSWRPLCKSGLSFLTLWRSPVVCCVVTSAAAVYKLLPWDRALTGRVLFITSHYNRSYLVLKPN